MSESRLIPDRRGWLPDEVWRNVLEDNVPTLHRGPIMGIVPEEMDEAFDPYTFTAVSSNDFLCLSARLSLSEVNKQLRMLLRDSYLLPQDCLVVTSGNARRVRGRLERAPSEAQRHCWLV